MEYGVFHITVHIIYVLCYVGTVKSCNCSFKSFCCKHFTKIPLCPPEFSIKARGLQSVPVNPSQENPQIKIKMTSANAQLLPLMHDSRDFWEFCSKWIHPVSTFTITVGQPILRFPLKLKISCHVRHIKGKKNSVISLLTLLSFKSHML